MFYFFSDFGALQNEMQAPQIQPPQINFQFQVPSTPFPNIEVVNKSTKCCTTTKRNLLCKNNHEIKKSKRGWIFEKV